MNTRLAYIVSIALGVFAQLQCWAAPILLKSGAFDPSDAQVMARRASLKTLATKPAKGGERVYIVQKDGLVDAAWRSALTGCGAKVLRYLPENAYLVRATAEAAAKVEQDVPHAYFGEYRPEHRLDAPMRKLVAQPTADKAQVCTVSLFDGAEREEVAAAIASLDGCKVLRGNGKVLRAELTPKGVGSVSALAAVEWVAPHRERRILNNVATEKSRMNVTAVWPGGETGLGLTGAGQVVAVADTGLDSGNLNTLHEDLRGRVTRAYARGRQNDWSDLIYMSYFDWWSWQYVQGYDGAHGTHVAGSVLGNGKMSNGQIRGPAYEASLIFQSVVDNEGYFSGLPDDLNELFQQAYDDENGKPGARIHSNSWGSDALGEYSVGAQDVDEFSFSHPDMLILISAGNSGVDANGNGVVDENSLCEPSTAKNCLTVGAAENQRTTGGYSTEKWGNLWPDDFTASPVKDDYPSRPKDGSHQGMAAFSSRGPCADGRIKPDIVAPGTDILSVKVVNWPDDAVDDMYWGSYNKYYAYMGGTSMSTPLTAGAAALVRQWLVRDAGIENPDGATVKALLLAGAKSLYPGQYGTGSYQEIPKGYPNNVEGWGQVNLGETVRNANGIVIRDGMFIQDGATDTYKVTVPMPGSLSVVMAYADAPGSPSSSKALVNDLDLLVKGPDGKTYYPNSGSSPDRVNNVEGVRFDAAKAGEYVITVKAYNVATPMSTSLTGGKSNAVRYSLAVLGAQSVGDKPPTPVEEDKPDLRPWTLIDEMRGRTWSAPVVLLTETWDESEPWKPCDLVGKTEFSVNDTIYLNWAVANFSATAPVKETYRTAILIDGQVGKLQPKGQNLIWTTYGLATRFGDWSGNNCIGKLPVGTHTVTLVIDYDNVVDRLQPELNTYEVTITVTADGPVDPGASQFGLGQVSTIGEFPDPHVSSTIAGISGLDGDNATSRFDKNVYPHVLTDPHVVDAEKLSGRQVDYTWCQQLTDIDILTFTGHASAFGYDDEDDFADYLRANPSLANADLVEEALAKEGPSAALCRTWISSDYTKFADTLEENLADGDAMASVGVDFGDVVHVMAVCGYAIHTGYRPDDPDRLIGLYCIDPDDDKRSDVRTAANQICFYYVYWDADERVYWMSRDYEWEGRSYDEGVILCDEDWGLGYVLRAKAAVGTVTVEFDANGGECATKSQNYAVGSKYGTLPRATKGDTMLLGWYTKRTGGKRVNAVSTVSADVTRLYARWQDEGERGPQEVAVALRSSAGSASSGEIANGGTQVTFKRVLFPTWVKEAKLRLPDGGETDVYKGLVKVDWDGNATLVLTAEANESAEARTDKLVVNYSEDSTKVFCTVNISQAAQGGEQPSSDTASLSLGLSGAQWHKVSFNVLPDDPSPASVFGPVASKIESVVKGSDTKFWMPGIGGSLASVEIGAAYWVQTTDPNVAWTVTGTPHPETTIRLNKGWTMIGYALAQEGAVASVLKTALATGKIEDIVDETLFYPGSLTTMKPGRAYWVNATEAMTIRYDAQAAAKDVRATSVRAAGTRRTRAFAARMRSYRPTVLKSLAVTVSGRAPKAGDVLAAYEDGTGELCGECVALDDSGRMSGVVYVPDGARVRFGAAPSASSSASPAQADGPVLSSAVTVARSGETVKGQSVVLADPADEIAVEVTRGVAVALPLVTEVLPAAQVRVSGLPAGLKFAAKAVVDGKTGATTVPANTVYGVPSTASRKDREGAYVPSKVKVTLKEPGEEPVTFTMLMTVKPLPEWAVGTFDGACDGGVAKMTVSASGRLSGKLSAADERAVTCNAPNFTLREGDRFYADVTFKALREREVGRIVLEPYEVGGLRLGRVFPQDDGLPFGFALVQNAWKRSDIDAPKIPSAGVRCSLYGAFTGVTLKLRSNGAVTVTDVRSGRKSVSSAQLLLEEGSENTAVVLVNGDAVRLQLLVEDNVVTGAVHVE